MELPILPPRVPVIDMGIAQQPNDKIDWLQDAKFGMFIHWGVYAGPGKGEWLMHHAALPPEQYSRFAFPESGDQWFCADQYDPDHWAAVAKASGMKWMCLTARHHDGFCLFDSPHPSAFTSVQTLKRDLFAEYAQACRRHGLKVGLYYSPLSWRYPGYYDVTGTDCRPNPFGYRTDFSHKDNARLLKEENYVNVHKLMTGYGRIDHIFWDAAWLGEQGSDRDAAFFHEPGHFMDPDNPWPVIDSHADRDPAGRALGIMGMVRKHQPDVVTNPRYGWAGDFGDQEGGAPVTGPIRSSEIVEKCMSIYGARWGFDRHAVETGDILTRDRIIEHLANCTVRNMVFLLNFGPDRHGRMPAIVEQRLLEVGAWLEETSEAFYGTRGGPWHPVDGQYGFCYARNIVFAHILSGYSDDVFRMPSVGSLRPIRVYDVFSGANLPFVVESDRTVTIRGLRRGVSPADCVVGVSFDGDLPSAK